MHETTLTATTSSLVLNEIQRIDVTASVTSEQQVNEKKIFLLLKIYLLFFFCKFSNLLSQQIHQMEHLKFNH